MKKKMIWLVVICVFILVSYAGQTVEELETRLKTASGKEKVKILNTLAKSYISISSGKVFAYGRQALELSKKLNDTKGEAVALRNIGSGYRVLGKNKKSLQNFQKALEIFRKLEDKKSIGHLLHNIGIVYMNLSRYHKALEYLKESLTIGEEIGFKFGIASSLNIIGIIYDDLSNFHQALEYYLKALAMYEEMGNKKGIAILLNNVGVVYRKLGKYEMALEYYKKSLQIEKESDNKQGIARALNNFGIVYEKLDNCEKALEYHLKSLALKKKIGNKKDITSSYINIGNVYTYLKNYDKGFENFMKALTIKEEIGDKAGIADTLNNLGELYLKQRDYKKAFLNLNRSLKIAREINVKDVIKNIYLNMSKLFSEKGDYQKALDYYKLYSREKDTIINKESNDKIAELHERYEAEKKEKKIALLQKNNEIQKLRLSKERFKANAFIAGFILVLIIALLLFKKYLHLFAFWKKKNYIGHYRIVEQIGSGGMGVVYKASHVMERSKSAAVKVIREEYCKNLTQRKRFMNEALLVDQLNHPNIVKVFERGEYNQQLFIAMELLEGQSLAERIQKGEHIPLDDCLKIMNQLIDTIAGVHAKGIIHRDLKPENIVLIEKGGDKNFVKLLDFGLARSESFTRLTETGEILGTINYLPPERITRQEYSAASDIYSLGVVFYEMLTLEKPFPGEAPIDIIKQILEKDPIEPNKFRPEIPGKLNDLILQMMSKEPDMRPNENALLKTF